MRVSELSTAAGVPVATIKYYLREGLLPAGRRTSPTQAVYDESHVARLRLVRALTEVAGLSLGTTRRLLDTLDHVGVHEALGIAQAALPPPVGLDTDATPAKAVAEAMGWRVSEGSVALRQLAVALRAADEAGLPLSPERLETYGTAAARIAAADVDGVPTSSLEDAVAYSVVGTVLYEPVLLALRRLAHEDASSRRFDS